MSSVICIEYYLQLACCVPYASIMAWYGIWILLICLWISYYGHCRKKGTFNHGMFTYNIQFFVSIFLKYKEHPTEFSLNTYSWQSGFSS